MTAGWDDVRDRLFACSEAFFQPHTEIGFFVRSARDAAPASDLRALFPHRPWIRKEIRDWYFPIVDRRLLSFRLREERTGTGVIWIAIASLAARRYERIAVRLHADREFPEEPLTALTAWVGATPNLLVSKTRELMFLEPFHDRRGGCVKSSYASVALDRIHRFERAGRPIEMDSPLVVEFEYGGVARPLAVDAIAAFQDWARKHSVTLLAKTRRKYASAVATPLNPVDAAAPRHRR